MLLKKNFISNINDKITKKQVIIIYHKLRSERLPLRLYFEITYYNGVMRFKYCDISRHDIFSDLKDALNILSILITDKVKYIKIK